MDGKQLIGRETECSRIRGLLGAAHAGHGGALILHGAPGTGKSALCHFAVRTAYDMTVTSSRRVGSEIHLPFLGLLEVLRPMLHLLQEIPAPQAKALLAAFVLTEGVSTQPFALNLATHSLMAVAAESLPLLIVIDDAHWLDGPSAEALMFAARRAAAHRVALLFTVGESRTRPELDDANLPELALDNLDHAAAEELLTSVHPAVSPVVIRQLVDHTRGNPLALLEVAALLTRDQLSARSPIADPLPLGPRLRGAFRRLVATLPKTTQTALLVAAATHSPALSVVIPAVERMGCPPDAFDAAERANVVRFSDTEVCFSQPLLRSYIYYESTTSERRRVCRVLADVVADGRRNGHASASVRAPQLEGHEATVVVPPSPPKPELIGTSPSHRSPPNRKSNGRWTVGEAAVSDPARLNVHLLGPPIVALNGRPVTEWPSKRGWSLFKYLVTHRHPWPQREVLMTVFWPESEPGAARNSLNVAVHSVRQALRIAADDPLVVLEGGAYRLHHSLHLWLDVEQFERHVDTARALGASKEPTGAVVEYERAAALYRGDFASADPAEEWSIFARDRLRLMHLDALDRLSELYSDRGRYASSIMVCQRILEQDPCREDAHRRLMCCYARQGHLHLALRQYRVCVTMLEAELGVDAAPATKELCERIRRRELL